MTRLIILQPVRLYTKHGRAGKMCATDDFIPQGITVFRRSPEHHPYGGVAQLVAFYPVTWEGKSLFVKVDDVMV